jgi:uncharacterized phage protein gp47/JayE
VYSEDELDILNRMIGNVPSDVDASEGTFVYDALSPTASEIVQQEINLDQVLLRVFATTAAANGYSTELENRTTELGITRKSGTHATATVQITGTDGTYTDVTVQTVAGLQYTIDSINISSGTGTATAIAAAIGTAYNVVSGTITDFAAQISGLTGVTNTTAVTGGSDVETDADLLTRYLTKVQSSGKSGNKADYENWALGVAGVGAVQVMPLWNGNGTVKVVLLGTDKTPAGDGIVTTAQSLICPGQSPTGGGLAPIGATVTVCAATAVPINVSATLAMTGTQTATEIQSAFQAALVAYLASRAFIPDPANSSQNISIKLAQIGALLLNQAGVSDYSNLKINGGTSNVAIAIDQVPIVGTVALS